MVRSLRHFIRISAALLFIVSFAGCASGAKIMGDYDRGVDCGAYQTWDFIKDAGPDYQGYESLFSKYMVEAITLEMDKRGYTKSSDPDIFLNFNAVVQDKTKVTQTSSMGAPMGMGGYYGYRGGSYGAWGGYGYGTETRVSQYKEGTFNSDIIDAKRKQLVWEEVGIGTVPNTHSENLRQTVMNGVPEFFTLYPFVAGNSTPVESAK